LIEMGVSFVRELEVYGSAAACRTVEFPRTPSPGSPCLPWPSSRNVGSRSDGGHIGEDALDEGCELGVDEQDRGPRVLAVLDLTRREPGVGSVTRTAPSMDREVARASGRVREEGCHAPGLTPLSEAPRSAVARRRQTGIGVSGVAVDDRVSDPETRGSFASGNRRV